MEKRNLFQRILDFFIKLFKVIASLFIKEEKKDPKELATFETNIKKHNN